MGGFAFWLMDKKFGLPRLCWIILIPFLIWGAVAAINHFTTTAFDKTEELGREAGSSEAIITGQNQTFEQLGDANDAEAKIFTGGERNSTRFAECLRNNERRSACERFRPVEQ